MRVGPRRDPLFFIAARSYGRRLASNRRGARRGTRRGATDRRIPARANGSAASRRRSSGIWATGLSGSRSRRVKVQRSRSWRSVPTGRCRSRIAKTSAWRCRRSSTSRSRWLRPTGWRFRLRASIGRSCVNPISPAQSATKRASRWRGGQRTQALSRTSQGRRIRTRRASGADSADRRRRKPKRDRTVDPRDGRGATRFDGRPHPRRAASRKGCPEGSEASFGPRDAPRHHSARQR